MTVSSREPGRRNVRYWIVLPAILVVYVIAGKLGLRFALDYPIASPVWPPTGLAMAAVVLWGFPVLPVIFLGAFVVNVTTTVAIPSAIGIAAGNMLEAGAGAWFINRLAGGRRVASDPAHLLVFAFLAGALATTLSATLGAGSLVLGGQLEASDFWRVWLTWWLGDSAGALLFTPLVLVWAERTNPLPRSGSRRLELVVLAVALTTISGLVFTGHLPPGLGYVATSILVWAAFRFAQRATLTVAMIWSAIALIGTLKGYGPFVRSTPNESLILLQTYIAVLALTALAMSAAVRQRAVVAAQRAEELENLRQTLLREEEERRDLERERQRLAGEQEARIQAERLNRQKDEFLATVSHELRTPLGAVLGWAEILRQLPSDAATASKAAEAILRNARLQARLISDLLDVSRIITAGKLDLRLQPMDPCEVVGACLDQFRDEAARKSIALEWSPPSRSERILGDPERFGQAVGNVIGNAVKFTPEGGSVRVILNQDDGAELLIRDTGPGIPAELLPVIFDRFTQNDRSTTRRHGGLGLGLSIASHIVDLHGGTIEARNEDSGGATFVIRVPSSPAVSGTPGTSSAPGDESPSSRNVFGEQPLSGASVLVVDDNDGAREITVAMLERAGAIVHSASSALAGLEMLSRVVPNLMVVDLAMPEIDGYTFLERARESSQTLPAIALTAHAAVAEEERARAAGFDRFLAKPVTPHALIAAVLQASKGNLARK